MPIQVFYVTICVPIQFRKSPDTYDYDGQENDLQGIRTVLFRNEYFCLSNFPEFLYNLISFWYEYVRVRDLYQTTRLSALLSSLSLSTLLSISSLYLLLLYRILKIKFLCLNLGN